MAGLLYFLPGKMRDVRAGDAIAAGLGHYFDEGCTVTPCQVAAGPGDGGSGVVIADPSNVSDLRVGYYPDKQTWRKVPGGDVWVGFYSDQRPKPQELLRDDAVTGHAVTLADHQRWFVPVARAWVDDSGDMTWINMLPARSTLDDDGNWQPGDVVGHYRPLWEIAERWFDAWSGSIDVSDPDDDEKAVVEFTFNNAHDAAVTALSANYRVGCAEAALLGLLDEQVAEQILDALIDVPSALALIKKKLARGGSPIAGGQTGTASNTDQR